MKLLKCAVLPALAGFATALLFLLAGSLALAKTMDPSAAMRILPFVACILGASLCGVLSVLLDGEERSGRSVLAGAMLLVLQLICSLAPGGAKGIILPIAMGAGELAICVAISFLFKKTRKKGRKRGRKTVKIRSHQY